VITADNKMLIQEEDEDYDEGEASLIMVAKP
jgi:hypothetical protein